MNDQIWLQAKNKLRSVINEQIYETWIQPTVFSSYSENGKTMVISVPNKRFAEWLTERYYIQIIDTLEELTNQRMKVIFFPFY